MRRTRVELSFDVHLDPNLDRTLTTDTKRLQQVLKNLLSNAFKFTAQGGVRLTVSAALAVGMRTILCLAKPRSVVSFEVSDTGIGIPFEKQKMIFEAFQQADASTSRKYGGTGLGLAISRELATLLGGEIHLRSAPNSGSSFTLYLPIKYSGSTTGSRLATVERRCRCPQSRRNARSSRFRTTEWKSNPATRYYSSLRTIRIMRRILLDLARDKGFKVLLAVRGDDAIDLAKQYQPTAVSLDVFLPDMLGWNVLSQIKQNPLTRHIPVQIVRSTRIVSTAWRVARSPLSLNRRHAKEFPTR